MNDSEPIGQNIDEGEVGFVDFSDFFLMSPFILNRWRDSRIKIRYETYGN